MEVRLPSPRALGVAAAVALGALGVTWGWASSGIGGWERSWVRWASSAPDLVWWPMWLVMQLGTVAGVVVVAGAVGVRWRRWSPVVLVAVTAAVARTVSDLAKRAMARPRPPSEAVTELREGAAGFGYPSSHTAVAVAIAVVAWPWLPRPLRVVLVVLAGTVGAARVVAGVHLPLDVVGGAAVGALVGVAALAAARTRPDLLER